MSVEDNQQYTLLNKCEVYNLIVAEAFSTKPRILDPKYMLLIDCRKRSSYEKGHLHGAHHHSCLDSEFGCLIDFPHQLQAYDLIVLFDDNDDAVGKRLTNKKIFYFKSSVAYKQFVKTFPFTEASQYSNQASFHTWPSQVIEDELYIGTAEHATSPRVVQGLGITHVVNVTPQHLTFPSGVVDCLRIPLQDESGSNLLRHLDSASDFIAAALKPGSKKSPRSKVLVHCHMGRSRSATVVCAYLMRERGMSLRDASSHLRGCRDTVQPNQGFVQQLLEYERRLHGGEQVSTIQAIGF